MKQIFAGPSNTVAQISYTSDSVGNLIARQDGLNNIFEMYCYDSLNRLTESSTATGGASGLSACSSIGTGLAHKTIAYDAIGNITNKSDVGGYGYGASGSRSVRPHAVSSITGTVNGVTNPSYTDDARAQAGLWPQRPYPGRTKATSTDLNGNGAPVRMTIRTAWTGKVRLARRLLCRPQKNWRTGWDETANWELVVSRHCQARPLQIA